MCPCPSAITDNSVHLMDSPENNLERKVLQPHPWGAQPGGADGLAWQAKQPLEQDWPTIGSLRLPSTPSAWEVLSSRSF